MQDIEIRGAVLLKIAAKKKQIVGSFTPEYGKVDDGGITIDFTGAKGNDAGTGADFSSEGGTARFDTDSGDSFIQPEGNVIRYYDADTKTYHTVSLDDLQATPKDAVVNGTVEATSESPEGVKTNVKLHANNTSVPALIKNMEGIEDLEGLREFADSGSLQLLAASAKNADPYARAQIRNKIINYRDKVLDQEVQRLRSKGKNIQAFVLKNKDRILSGGMGLAAGGLGYMGTYAGLGMMPYFKQRKLLRFLLSSGVGLGAGAASGYLSHKFLTRHYTPSTRASYADVLGTLASAQQDVADAKILSEKY